jgi:predicted DNA-binding transcriptional regulator YafY
MDESTANQDQPSQSFRDEEPSALLTRLRVIEDQPLDTRAEALAQLHDELRTQLESGDAARPHA